MRPVDKEIVQALIDLASVMSAVREEFPSTVDRAAILEASEWLLLIAQSHDSQGNYGLAERITEAMLVLPSDASAMAATLTEILRSSAASREEREAK